MCHLNLGTVLQCKCFIAEVLTVKQILCKKDFVKSSSFQDLLKKDNSVSIHYRNIQALATEMFKVKNNIAPEIMKELFAPKMSSYDLRNNNSFKRRRVKSVWHGTESVSYLGPKIWDLVPNEIKESKSLNAFKFKREGGSLKNVLVKYEKYRPGKWGL